MKEALKMIFNKDTLTKSIKSVIKNKVKSVSKDIADKVTENITEGVQDKLSDIIDKVDDGLLEKISSKLPDELKTLFEKNKNVTTEYLNELIRSIDLSEKLDEISKNEFLKKALSLNAIQLKEYNDNVK